MTDSANDDNYEPSPWEPVAEQVERYLATNGEEGYEWGGGKCIILTTTGRRSGKLRRTPLMKVKHGDGYLVVASLGGAPQHPQWYLNITANPEVVINDRAERHELIARTATPEEKKELWPLAVAEWPDYDKYQESTERDIPLVICEPR
ncbi:MAG: nitroreductase family deazaflavin-dependent oxidoreductase [Acidimicrobiales bacterium]